MTHASHGARPSAEPHDLPPFIEPVRSNFEGVANPLGRPVLILVARCGSDDREPDILAIAEAARDAIPDAGPWACVIDGTGNHGRWRFPRGLRWTDLPVVLPARTQLRLDDLCGVIRMRPGPVIGRGGGPIAHALEDPLAIVVVPAIHGGPERTDSPQDRLVALADCLDIVEGAGLGDRPIYAYGECLEPTTLADLRLACAPAEPLRTLRYNWHLNFMAIGVKALRHALERQVDDRPHPPEGRRVAGNPGPGAIGYLRANSEKAARAFKPLSLQLLYAIDRAGGVDVTDCIGPYGEEVAPLVTPLFDETQDGLEWRGTGKHPPLRIDWWSSNKVFHQLRDLLLVEVIDRRLVVTAVGRRFLDALHPDCEDADMPCRWANRPLDETDARSIEASLMRTFRKLKTRVNALPRGDEPSALTSP